MDVKTSKVKMGFKYYLLNKHEAFDCPYCGHVNALVFQSNSMQQLADMSDVLDCESCHKTIPFTNDARFCMEKLLLLDDSILHEAHRVVRQRIDNYGGPQENFKMIAAMWSQILGGTITTTQVGLMMIALKIARHCHKPIRDNLVDIAGYVDCISIIEEGKKNDLQPTVAP